MAVRQVRVGEVLERVNRAVTVKPESTYPNVGVLNRARGVFRKQDIIGTETKYRQLHRLAAGDIVYSKLFGWEGAVAVVPEWADGTFVSGEFPTYTVSDQIDRHYLRHVIAWEGFASQLAVATTGMGQRRQRVNPVQFEFLVIPLPDLPEQQRIGARLDRVSRHADGLNSRVGAGTAALRSIPPLLEQAWASANLPSATVGELCQPVNDLVRPGQDPSPATDFVGLEYLQSHTGLRVGSGPVSGLSGRKFRFQPGDVLYGYLRPYQNKVWAADLVGLCSVEQYVLRPDADVPPRLLSLLLRSRSVLEYAVRKTNSLQLPRLGLGALLAAPVPDVRLASHALEQALQARVDNSTRAASLMDQRDRLASSVLPAARNEEFARLT